MLYQLWIDLMVIIKINAIDVADDMRRMRHNEDLLIENSGSLPICLGISGLWF